MHSPVGVVRGFVAAAALLAALLTGGAAYAQVCTDCTACADGSACDDSLFCTAGETCTAGVCGGGAPTNESLGCDDGLFCTVSEVCTAGTCGTGGARNCGALDGACAVGVCNETTDACEAQPANEGLGCDDGLFCTTGDACVSGTCTAPAPRDCSALDGACATGVCSEAADACQAQPVNEGEACDDGLFCTTGDECSSGTCAGPTPRDCSALDGACVSGLCNEAADACLPQPANEGLACDDGIFCNGMDVCSAVGTCSHPGDPCVGLGECKDDCNEATNTCVTPGVPCTDEGNQCTDDRCNVAGACQHSQRPNGFACNDGQFCTTTDQCVAGACVGTGDPCAGGAECAATCNETVDDCFAANTTVCTDDGSLCTDDRCNGMGACGHPPNTVPCDDGVFCNGTDTCSGGACAHAGDPCLPGAECANTCDETARNCITPAGAPCTDVGVECTTDLCLAGACDHAPADAPCDQGECVLGSCVPGSADADKRGCVATAVGEGEQCTDDGFSCTDDTCNGGSCLHVPIASRCVPPEDCTSAECAPGQPTADAAGCLPGPVLEEGQQCAEDGEPCTNDLCRTGSCAHDEVPDTATCEPVTRAFRQALALEGLARRLMASVDEAFAPSTSGPAVVIQGSMVARLTPVTASLEGVSRTLSGKSVLPPDDGRARGVPKTLAQLRADAALDQLAKKPADVRAFLRLVGSAKRKKEIPRETARALRASGRLVLERMRNLKKELRRLRRVSQTFVP